MAEKQYGDTMTPSRNLEKSYKSAVVPERRLVRLISDRRWTCEVLETMLKI